MIVRSGQAFIFRDIFDRFGVVSIQRRVRRYCRPHLKRRGHPFATLGVWSFLSELAGRNEVLLSDRPVNVPVPSTSMRVPPTEPGFPGSFLVMIADRFEETVATILGYGVISY